MRAAGIKTGGYLVSCASVGLLGVAAFPGAEKAGLLPALFGGMGASVVGMGLRWVSYELEERRKAATGPLATGVPSDLAQSRKPCRS
jgi:hypothetical protein